MYEFLQKKNHVLLFGPTGVGKSRVKQNLIGDMEALVEVAIARTDKHQIEKTTINKKPLIIHDVPGDRAASFEMEKGIDEITSKSEYGILIIGAYGYHESRYVRPEPSFTPEGLVSPSWLAERMEFEHEFFEYRIRELVKRNRTQYVYTLINKADLWLSDKDKVDEISEIYGEFSYSSVVRERGVTHRVIPYCARPQYFYGKKEAGSFLNFDQSRELQSEFLGRFVQWLK